MEIQEFAVDSHLSREGNRGEREQENTGEEGRGVTKEKKP